MNKYDEKNKEHRRQRNERHDKRANQELEDFFRLYENKINVISYDPLDMKKSYQKYLVSFTLSEPIKPGAFVKMLIEAIGDKI